MQDQTTTATLYPSANTTNFTGLASYAAYFNADDVFGASVSNLSATVLASLASYASKTATASNNTLSAATTESLFRTQHDLIFTHKIPIAELIVAPAATGPLTLLEYWGLSSPFRAAPCTLPRPTPRPPRPSTQTTSCSTTTCGSRLRPRRWRGGSPPRRPLRTRWAARPRRGWLLCRAVRRMASGRRG